MRKSVVAPLTLGYLIMSALMGLMLLMSLHFASQLYLGHQRVIGVDIPRQVAAGRLRADLLAEYWAARRYLDSDDLVDRAQVEISRARTDRNVDVLSHVVEGSEWDALWASYQGYHTLLDGSLYYVRDAEGGAPGSGDQVDVALAEVLGALEPIDARLESAVEDALDHYQDLFQRRFILVLGVGAWLILAGAVTGLTLGRSITRPLGRLTEVTRQLGAGDLTAVPEIPAANEIGDLAGAFRQMTRNLGQAIERMRETASALTSSADRLSSSATDLGSMVRGTLAQMGHIAQGAETQLDQMGTVAELAAGIATALYQSAQQAGEVGQAAQGAQAKLVLAERVVSVLDQEAAEIQNITAIIEQFAQETHMLSLNASIEARRAGQAGRGFAAVSDEMRALAERSAQSAGEVARFGARVQAEMESIGQAVSEVQGAVAQTASFAGRAVDAARQQERDTARLADVVDQAVTVSKDQARIAEQVSADVAQQADAISELASAARGLTRLVGQLESLTERFDMHVEPAAAATEV
jgi:methyl-accepting chemotaxis protein